MRLRAATATDVDAIMAWFPDEKSIRDWGGPGFHYPFDRASFHRDCKWQEMPSFCLDSHGVRQGFGQFYARYGRVNLARLVVHPDARGCGLGQTLINALIDAFADENAIVVPTYQGQRGNPVIIGRAHFPALQRLSGDTGARDLLRAAGVTRVEMDTDAIFADYDTPEALP